MTQGEAAIAAPGASEEFWDDLLSAISDRQVIPVLGPDLLKIVLEGRVVPLYRAVADRLLTQYRQPPLANESQGLYEAVSALASTGRRVRDLYRPIYEILQTLTAAHPEALAPLLQLAKVSHFGLFATTTPDVLLARAINEVRFGGNRQVQEIEYAPKLPTKVRENDVPEVPTSQYAGVVYLLGKASGSPVYAIHEEDALEFLYTIQTDGPERALSRMRQTNLLLIGCALGDSLSRFFLRLSNTDRLSAERIKREYLVRQGTSDQDLVVFLQRFSRDSRYFPVDAVAFVDELVTRWQDRQPPDENVGGGDTAAASPTGNTIFISYAHEDIGAARRLFEDLHKLSGDVAWFDKSALTPGDQWDQQIRAAIAGCRLFLPIISSSTEQRTDGYFRGEWSDAVRRSNTIAGRKFIFPIVIDETFSGKPGDYKLVPDRFADFQYGHAPRGQMNDQLRDSIRDQLRAFRRGRTA